MRYLLLVVLVVSIALPAAATPPNIGTYYPENGRFCESWKNGQEGAKDNTITAMSWNLSVLAGQWILDCMVAGAQAVETSNDLDEFGTGSITYETVYGGGSLWLAGTGPWGDGSEDYSCSVGPSGMVVTVTHQYVLGNRISAVSDVRVRGVFDNYSNCFSYTLTNAAIEGAGATVPPQYPEYQDETCATGTSVFGAWGSVDDITFVIYSPTDPECTVPARDVTWGEIKSMYSE